MDFVTNLFAAIAGSVMTMITGFLLTLYREHRKADTNDFAIVLKAAIDERAAAFNEIHNLRAELVRQTNELREQIRVLQEDKLKYVEENTRLNERLVYVIEENNALKLKVIELEERQIKIEQELITGSTHATDTHRTADKSN